MNIRSKIAGVAAAALVGGLTALAVPTAASAHTPEITTTCSSISANLTNYEYVAGTPAEYKTEIVTPYKPGVAEVPEILGQAPVITPEAAATYATELEYIKGTGVYGETMTKWFPINANPQEWETTGNTREVEVTPYQPAVYGPQPIVQAYVPAVPEQLEVTKQVEVKPAVAAQDNTITLELDGAVVAGPIHFGKSYAGTYSFDGTKGHTYKVTIDAIGTAYDKTFTGTTKACPVPIQEIPYPTLVATEICGADNDTVTTDPAWIEQYGHLVAGPWIDTKYKTIDGKRVVDGSAQIKAEFRKTHIWAGSGDTSASDFRRWMMYPGTASFTHQDVATDCPIPENPGPVVVTGEWTTGAFECGDTTVQITREVTSTEKAWNGSEYVDGESVTVTQTETRDLTAEEIASLDCTVPPVTPEEPTTPEEPVAPVEPVLGQGGDDGAYVADATLAQTGVSPAVPLIGGAFAVALLAGGVVLMLRRRQLAVENVDSE